MSEGAETMSDVLVNECGLRDGLQLTRTVLPTQVKCAVIDALASAGLREIEVASFVPAHVSPHFADAAEVVAHAKGASQRWKVSALVPNLKGAERAIAAGTDILAFVVSVSESHNLANVRRTPQEQAGVGREIVERVNALPTPRAHLIGALATAFGCSIEGPIEEAAVVRMAVALREAGFQEITLADTVGYADPAMIKRRVKLVRDAIGSDVPLRLHLHDTMGTGLANALAGLEAGVTRFDAAILGLGGCPAAPGASGNISTEDLVYMLERMGVSTGIDLGALIAAGRLVHENLPDEPVRSHVFGAGIPKKIYGVAA
jgi:hydroxymethylglutaryl-CoA lyase